MHAALRAAPMQDGRAGTDTACQQNGSSDSLQQDNSMLVLAQSFADVLVMKHPILKWLCDAHYIENCFIQKATWATLMQIGKFSEVLKSTQSLLKKG